MSFCFGLDQTMLKPIIFDLKDACYEIMHLFFDLIAGLLNYADAVTSSICNWRGFVMDKLPYL